MNGFRYPKWTMGAMVLLLLVVGVWMTRKPYVMVRESMFINLGMRLNDSRITPDTLAVPNIMILSRPLPYWILGQTAKVMKYHLGVTRMFHLIVSILFLGLVYYLLKPVFDPVRALYVVLLLFTSYQYFFGSVLAVPDIYGVCFHGLAMIFFTRLVLLSRRKLLNSAAMGLMCALAAFSMGVAALTIPMVTILVYLTLQNRHLFPLEWKTGKSGYLVIVWVCIAVFMFILSATCIYSGYIVSPKWTTELSTFAEKIRTMMIAVIGQQAIEERSIVWLLFLIAACSLSAISAAIPYFMKISTENTRTTARHVVISVLVILLCLMIVAVPLTLKAYNQYGVKYLTAVSSFDRHNEHSGKSDFYLRAVGLGLFPWSFFVPFAFIYMGLNVIGRNDPKPTFIISWALASFAVMTFIEKKFFHYYTPALLPFAIVVVLSLFMFMQDQQRSKYKMIILLSIVYALILIKDQHMIGGSPFLDLLVEHKLYGYENLRLPLSIVFYVLFMGALLRFWFRKPVLTGINTVMFISVIYLVYQFVGFLVVVTK